MWVIVRTDPEDDDYPLPEILMNEDGSAKTFINEITAWRYMELICKEYNYHPDMFMNDPGVGIMRVH